MKLLERKIPPLALVIVFSLMMFSLAPYLPVAPITARVSLLFSLTLLSVGVFFVVSGVVEFRRKKTTVDPREPEKTSALVTSGVYKISRNPMYVGFAVCLLALVVCLRSPVLIFGVILFVLYMNRFQIEPEERVMATMFGDEYVRYKAYVRRWF